MEVDNANIRRLVIQISNKKLVFNGIANEKPAVNS